jgi:hypothetical protein
LFLSRLAIRRDAAGDPADITDEQWRTVLSVEIGRSRVPERSEGRGRNSFSATYPFGRWSTIRAAREARIFQTRLTFGNDAQNITAIPMHLRTGALETH